MSPKTNLGYEFTCQKCLRRKASTKTRTFRHKSFTGPCGDSFCYASCDSSSCKAITRTICDECLKKEGKKP